MRPSRSGPAGSIASSRAFRPPCPESRFDRIVGDRSIERRGRAAPALTKASIAMDESTSSTESMKAARPSQRIGSYRVLSPLGIGGMSSVFRAVHVETNHEVALKVLTRSLARNATLASAFLARGPQRRDARAPEHRGDLRSRDRLGPALPGARVRRRRRSSRPHPAAGPAQPGRGGLGGQERRGRAQVRRQSGLDPSRRQAVEHPANADGTIKIIDLGLALQNEFEDERVTRDGTTVGTVDYMAPEQARDSRATSIQSDMYSLGCTFYYLLAGVPPFPAATSPTSSRGTPRPRRRTFATFARTFPSS